MLSRSRLAASLAALTLFASVRVLMNSNFGQLRAILVSQEPRCELPSAAPRNLTNPGRLSYSQWLQDLTLEPILSSIKGGFFLESGAQGGEWNSNTLKYELDGWSGLLVEPQASALELLRLKHRKAYIFPGVLSATGRSEDVSFSAGGSAKSSGHIGRSAGVRLLDWLEWLTGRPAKTVRAEPLAKLLRSINRTTVDFWSLDVEGFEGAVLTTTDFSEVEVGVMLVETNNDDGNTRVVSAVMEKNGFRNAGYTYYKQGSEDLHMLRRQIHGRSWTPCM